MEKRTLMESDEKDLKLLNPFIELNGLRQYSSGGLHSTDKKNFDKTT